MRARRIIANAHPRAATLRRGFEPSRGLPTDGPPGRSWMKRMWMKPHARGHRAGGKLPRMRRKLRAYRLTPPALASRHAIVAPADDEHSERRRPERGRGRHQGGIHRGASRRAAERRARGRGPWSSSTRAARENAADVQPLPSAPQAARPASKDGPWTTTISSESTRCGASAAASICPHRKVRRRQRPVHPRRFAA
jgi:hypothetical protein